MKSTVFQGLFEAVPDALILVDGDGRIVQANAHAETLFGYPREGLAGREIEALVPEQARERHRAHRTGYTANPHVRPMGAAGQTLVGLRRDGTAFPVEIALSPLATDDGARYLASIRDISNTQRERQALRRARYDALAAHVGQLALGSSSEAAVIEAVPPLLEEALDIETVTILLAPTQREGAAHGAKAAAPALLTEPGKVPTRPLVIDDCSHEDAGRDAFPLPLPDAGSAAIVPLLQRNRVLGAIVAQAAQPRGFDHDALHLLQSVGNLLSAFLQQRRAEEHLAHSQRLDAVGQLTGGIAHDFNNLLTVMSGSLQLLEAECDDRADSRELIATALRSVGRGAELTGKLLAFARRQRLLPRSVDVTALLQDVALMLRRTLGDAIRLEVDCSDATLAAHVDPSQLETALVNLALNARDAMPRSGEIRFEAQRVLIDAGSATPELPVGYYVRILVADNGRGMAADTLARAMEPFFTTKDSGRGSGLGLSMVYGFARQSGGDLQIESKLGAGTRVWLYLPLSREAIPSAPPAPPAAVDGRGETVLVVEDDAAVRGIAVSFLRASGYRVEAVASGEQALERLHADAGIGFLFSDVMLGDGIDGEALARAARALRPQLGILLTSGYEDRAEDADPAFERLRKPYRREQLAAAVRRLLDTARTAAH